MMGPGTNVNPSMRWSRSSVPASAPSQYQGPQVRDRKKKTSKLPLSNFHFLSLSLFTFHQTKKLQVQRGGKRVQ